MAGSGHGHVTGGASSNVATLKTWHKNSIKGASLERWYYLGPIHVWDKSHLSQSPVPRIFGGTGQLYSPPLPPHFHLLQTCQVPYVRERGRMMKAGTYIRLPINSYPGLSTWQQKARYLGMFSKTSASFIFQDLFYHLKYMGDGMCAHVCKCLRRPEGVIRPSELHSQVVLVWWGCWELNPGPLPAQYCSSLLSYLWSSFIFNSFLIIGHFPFLLQKKMPFHECSKKRKPPQSFSILCFILLRQDFM